VAKWDVCIIPVGAEVEICRVDRMDGWRRYIMRKPVTFPWLAYADKLPVTIHHEGFYIRVPRAMLITVRVDKPGFRAGIGEMSDLAAGRGFA
jgi:hypothetical protein